MEMNIVYGILLLVVAVCSTIVSAVNHRKKKGYVLTVIIATLGYILGAMYLIVEVMEWI